MRRFVACALVVLGVGLHVSRAEEPNRVDRGRTLSTEGEAALAGGRYEEALRRGLDCAAIFADAGMAEQEVGCLTIVGRAKVYQGHYQEAAAVLRRAAAIAHNHAFGESEAAAWNDVGSAEYYVGDYSGAHGSFTKALAIVERWKDAPWSPRRRQIIVANLAMLEQRLGQYERALDTYRELEAGVGSMRASERARLLSNIGALYRRLGDPYKAIDQYKAAEQLLAEERDHDGEIGVVTNRGIALAMDLDDLAGAIAAFDRAERLAVESGNRRERAEAALYSSEALRRLGRLHEARAKAELALAVAKDLQASEETWKAQLSLGRIAEASGDDAAALTNYRDAIDVIEKLRTGIAAVSMRLAFLGDKIAAYDGAIGVLLKTEGANPAELFRYMEQGRARTLRDRLKGGIAALEAIQRRLADGTAVVEFWKPQDNAGAIWISRNQVKVLRLGRVRDGAIDEVVTHMRSGSGDWESPARELGRALATSLPLTGIKRLIISPDRRLQAVPFEVLPTGDDAGVLIDKVEVSYLPAASMLQASTEPRGWLAPWRRMLAAFAFTGTAGATGLFGESLPPLQRAAYEVREVAKRLGGRAELHTESQNLKSYAMSALAGTPALHFATHGIADPDDPDRSRLAFSGVAPGTAEYLFAGEIYGLRLSDVRIATLAACDTEAGKTIGGEGTAALSRAFLGAGVRTTISTLWRISDRSSGAFMNQFYERLADGRTAGEALREAKLAFRRSGTELAHPRHWAAYVLNGDAGTQTPRPTLRLTAAAAVIAYAGLMLALLRRRTRTAAAQRELVNR